MTKKDLRTGMVVEIRNGAKYTVMLNAQSGTDNDDILANHEGGFVRLSNYRDDLSDKNNDDFDIIRVFEHFGLGALLKFNDRDMKVLWERDHEPKVGDVYESTFGNLCVVTMVNDSNITKVYNDGSGGYEKLEAFKRDYKFTGKNIGDKVDKLLKAI